MEWVNKYDFSTDKQVLTTERLLDHALSYTHGSGQLETLYEQVQQLQQTLVLVVSMLPPETQAEIVKKVCYNWELKGENA